MLELPRILAYVTHWEYCNVFNDPLEGACTCGLRELLEEVGWTEEDLERARAEAERCWGF